MAQPRVFRVAWHNCHMRRAPTDYCPLVKEACDADERLPPDGCPAREGRALVVHILLPLLPE